MAITLIANARLNAGQFKRTLAELGAATSALHRSEAKGARDVADANKRRIASTMQAGRAAVAQERAAQSALQSRSRAIAQATALTAEQRAEMQRLGKLNEAAVSQATRMSAAEARALNARRNLSAATRELARLTGNGITEGRQYEAAQRRVATATQSVGQAMRAVNAERAKATALTQSEVRGQQAIASAGRGVATGLAAQRYLYHDLSRQAAMTSLALAAIPAASIFAAASWEKSFANVVRTADPAFSQIDSKVQGLRTSLVQMVEAMPTSFGDVTEIATLANQMGIAANQTAEFTRAVTMFSATSGVSVDITATAFGRLTSILGDNAIAFNEMSDSILKVGVNSVATEEEIINVTTQISAIAAQAGFTAQDMIGLAGAMASVRVPPELSRGVTTRVFGQISRAVSDGGDSLQNFARISGMSASEFRDSWGTKGAAATFTDFLRGLRDLGPQAEAELRNLGITSVRDVPVLLRLANAADAEGNVGELLQQTLDDAYDAAGETQRQYTIMAETVAARFKVLGNNIVGFFDAVGAGALGPLGDILDYLSTGIRDLARMVRNGEADWLGWAVAAAGAASALALVGSGLAKVAAGWATAKHAFALLSGGGAAKGAAGAAGGFVAVGTGAERAATSTSKFGTAVRNVGRFAGPFALTLAGFALAAEALDITMYSAGTSAERLAERVSAINFDTSNVNALRSSLDSLFSSIEVYNFGVAGEGFFDRYFGTSSAVNSLKEYTKLVEEFSATSGTLLEKNIKSRDFTDMVVVDPAEVARTEKLMERFGDTLGHLVDAGNGPKALSMLKEMGLSTEALNDQLNRAPIAKDYIDSLLGMNGIDENAANRLKLVNGEFRDITDSLHGLQNLGAIELDDLFAGDEAAIGSLQTAISDTVKAFFDLKSAREAALDSDTGELDFSKFMQNMTDAAERQTAWVANMKKLGRVASQELMQELISQGPEMNDVIEGLLANPDALAQIEEAYRVTGETAADSGIEAVMAGTARLKSLLGEEVGSAVAEGMTDAQLSTVYGLFQEVGTEAAQRIADGLAAGSYSVDEAIGMLTLERELEINTDLNVDPAHFSLNSFAALAEGTVTTVQLDAMPAPAEGKIWQVVQTADGSTGFVEIDAETGKATDGIAHVVDEAGNSIGTVKLTANEMAAIAKIHNTKNRADSTQGTMKVNADASDAYAVIQSLDGTVTRSRHIITISTEGGGEFVADTRAGTMVRADGGVDYYANGGIRSQHVAQIAPAGAMRVWAEPETEGEAYIPLARSKRTRSVAILDHVAKRFGYSLTHATNVARFADGGQYMAQVMSRQRYTAASVRGSDQGAKVQVGPVTFANSSQKDQFREFTRTLNRVARGL